MISRGDIRWFRFSSPDKRRPVLVLGGDGILPSLSRVPVIPLSTRIRDLPWEVALTPDEGLPQTCVLKPEWIQSVERSQIGPLLTTFSDLRWTEVREALLRVLGLS